MSKGSLRCDRAGGSAFASRTCLSDGPLYSRQAGLVCRSCRKHKNKKMLNAARMCAQALTGHARPHVLQKKQQALLQVGAGALQMVLVFLWPPSMFFKPVIVKDVLAHLMTRSWTKMSSASRLAVMAFGLLVPAVVSTAVVRAF